MYRFPATGLPVEVKRTVLFDRISVGPRPFSADKRTHHGVPPGGRYSFHFQTHHSYIVEDHDLPSTCDSISPPPDRQQRRLNDHRFRRARRSNRLRLGHIDANPISPPRLRRLSRFDRCWQHIAVGTFQNGTAGSNHRSQ